jgi:hypothetical protein
MTIDKSWLVAEFRIPLLKPSKVTAHQEVLVVSIYKRDIRYYCLEESSEVPPNQKQLDSQHGL